MLLVLPFCAAAGGGAADGLVAAPARLRTFGQNGVGLTLNTNAMCEDQYDEEIEVPGSLGNAFRSMVGEIPGTSLGMPETGSIRTINEGKVSMVKPYYREYALVAGKPVMVQADIQSAANIRCSGTPWPVGYVRCHGMDALHFARIAAPAEAIPVPDRGIEWKKRACSPVARCLSPCVGR